MIKKRFQQMIIIPTILLFGLFCFSSPVLGATVDHTLFGELLKDHVADDGTVDYKGFQRDEVKLDVYLSVLAKTDPDGLPRDDQFAFYINAYNAWTIKLILSGYPGIESIKDLGSFFSSPWKKKIARIGGKVVTLDHIEHDILRPRFKDPRVHFAINCASKSCPPLRRKPYQGKRLNAQLDDAVRRFLNNPKSNYLSGRVLYASRIFKWFSEDFQEDVTGFFLKYAEGDLRKALSKSKNEITVKYLDYDWSLNGR